MKLSAPTALIFILSLILVVFGLVARFQPDIVAGLPDMIVGNAHWAPYFGYGLLTAGVLFKGL